jgi:TRAP-type C4-dicarboxylate transport system permease small subunit
MSSKRTKKRITIAIAREEFNLQTSSSAPVRSPETARSSPLGQFLLFILNGLMTVTETVGAILLAIMTLIITWQVIARFRIIHINSPWTEEVALMMLVWFGMTGAAIGIRKHSHIGVEFVTNLFPVKVQRLLAILVGLLIMTFSIFLFIEGIALAQGCWNDRMSATLLPRGVFVYLAVPAAAFLMTLYSAESVVRLIFSMGGNQDEL